MKNNTDNVKRKKNVVLYILILLLIIMSSYYIYISYRGNHEPPVSSRQTSTSSLYSLKSRMKLLSFFPKVKNAAFNGRAAQIDYGSYVIPGLSSTRSQVFGEKGTCQICTSMTPQGLAVTENYLLVSAYCHTGTHNSVIYVIDKKTHEFIKELVLKNKSHVGGLAYDPVHHNLWIACMSHGIPQVNAISLSAIVDYSFDDGYHPVNYSQSYDLYAITRSSFLTYYDNSLYVGYFTRNASSVVEQYTIMDDGTLETQTTTKPVNGIKMQAPIPLPSDTRVIENQVQGMAFYKDHLLFSHSYGIRPSTIQVYEDSYKKLLERSDSVKKFYLPEKLEQIYVDEDDLYILFESAAYGYQAKSFVKMDRILKLNLKTLLN